MKRYWSKEFGPAYFITNTVVEWKNIFIVKPYIKIVIDSWKHFQSKRDIEFYAFIVMPSHLHYIVQPKNEHYTIVDMQRDFKKFTSKRILDGLNYELKHGSFPEIEMFTRKDLHRGSPDELIQLFRTVGKYSGQAHKVWMPEEKPIAIHSEHFMVQKISYIHFNPVKSGYVQEQKDYPFSSARNFYLDDDSLMKVTKIRL